jgi:sugar lactone lactonase YvrE
MIGNPASSPAQSVAKETLEHLTLDVSRPECVLALRSGELFVSDDRGGVTHIPPSANARLIVGRERPADFLPNGIALLADRSLLIANLGADGGVWKLSQNGELTPWLVEVEGRRLPATNFVSIDSMGRVWISVSTFVSPRWDAYHRNGARDGVIILVDAKGARVVAEGFAYTNEVKVDPSGKWLYVNETVGRTLSRFALGPQSILAPREIVAEFGAGTYPDGLAFDVEGGVWITSVVSNRLFRVLPNAGSQELIFEDADLELVDSIEAKFAAGIFPGHEPGMHGISSLAFAGPDLQTVYTGWSNGARISRFRAGVRGSEPPHWRF